MITTATYLLLSGFSLFWAFVQYKMPSQQAWTRKIHIVRHISIFAFSVLLAASTGSVGILDFEVARIGVRIAMAGLLISYMYDTFTILKKADSNTWHI